jgi:hypothetical protein
MKTALHFSRQDGSDPQVWTFEHGIWLLGEMNRPLSKGGLGPNPKQPKSVALELGFGRYSPGSVETPWTMSSIEEWYGASQQIIGSREDEGFYEVGGVLLERNASSGDYANYFTAVVDPISNPMVPVYEWSPRGQSLLFHQPVDRSTRTVYEVKCERMNTDGRDREVAEIARAVMKRECKSLPKNLWELPNTLAAMFISEVTRLPLMMPLGLMLLDLIEAGVCYGTHHPKQYTWGKMMKYIDPTLGAQQRLSQAKLVGGKHPMMHENSIKQAKEFLGNTFNLDDDEYAVGYAVNAVTRRAVSVIVAWLHMYFRRQASNWITTVGREDIRANSNPTALKKTQVRQLPGIPNSLNTGKQSQIVNAFYTEAIVPALRSRASSLDLLLPT